MLIAPQIQPHSHMNILKTKGYFKGNHEQHHEIKREKGRDRKRCVYMYQEVTYSKRLQVTAAL